MPLTVGLLDCLTSGLEGPTPLRPAQPRAALHNPARLFLDHFRACLLTSSWGPHFLDFGANLVPFCPPTRSQNRPRIGPRAIQNRSKIVSYF